MNNSLKTVGTACLAVGLVSTWDATPANADTYTFSGQITPTTSLSDVYFLFSAGTCQPGGGVWAQEIAASLPANVTTPFTVSFNSIPSGFGLGDGIAIASLYDVGSGGVSLSYSPSQAASVLSQSPAPTWDGNWLPIAGGSIMYFYTESQVAASLASNLSGGAPFNPAGGPFPGLSTDPSNPAAFTLVDFSGASNGGSGTVLEVVPEPATVSVIAASLGSCLWLRRRNKI